MATLLQLKTRVYEEMNSRTDIEPGVGSLSGALTRAIEQAIEFYADEEFWWNITQATAVTIADQDYIDKPAAFRRVKTISLPAYYRTLSEVSIEQFYEATLSSVSSSAPDIWAEYTDDIKLYPTPDAVYTLQLVGVAEIGVPATDGASNAWTTTAYDLIAARARMILYRDQFRDIEGAGVASIAEAEALRDLRRNTRQRLSHPRRSTIPIRRKSFNINTGFPL